MNKYNEGIIYDDATLIVEEYLYEFKKLKNNQIIITGGAGFLLSYFCYIIEIANEKFKIPIKLIVLDKFFFGLPFRLKKFKKKKYIKFINIDLSESLPKNLNCDYFIHGASIASPTYYRKFPIETIKVNVSCLLKIFDKLFTLKKKVKSIIFMSSSEVYGNPDLLNIPTNENYFGNVSFTGPRACYDESKRIGETICVNYFQKKKLPIKIIRPFNVYGPGQNLNDKRIIPDIIKGLKNKNITLLSNGKATRSFCYISDQIRGILKVMFSGENGQSYNVGNDEMFSIRKITQMFIKFSKKKVLIKFKKSSDKNYTKDNPQKRCPDLKKIKKLKGNWKVRRNTEEGITRTLKYYKIIN